MIEENCKVKTLVERDGYEKYYSAYITGQVKLQLKDYKNSELDIRYQYSEGFPKELTMNESVKSILNSHE